ncbi:MAG: homoserine dehydrogenase [Abditibacteriaceae bacterium]
MKEVKLGIIGLGTVGTGTVRLLERNADVIARRAGGALKIAKIATLNSSKPRAVSVDPKILTGDVNEILNDPEIAIVAELIGGVKPAKEYVLRAIESGKSVVTANKELIAKYGADIQRAADKAGVDFLFEGSVGGGIPIIKPLRESLSGNNMSELIGIVNGTTNYILTSMTREGRTFDEVLAEAQRLGFAEADPSADVDAFDAVYKLAILADVAFGVRVRVDDIYREGIRGVSARDIDYATELGYVIKLVAVARHTDEGALELRVHPALLPNAHPLASVSDSFNAVMATGDAVGEVMFYGRGAGSDPTGSAVVGDLIEAARNIRSGRKCLVRHEPLQSTAICKFDDIVTRFCVRMQVADQPGVLAQIAAVFGKHGISLESVLQKSSDDHNAEIFWMTHRCPQRAMNASLQDFVDMSTVNEVSSVLRVESDWI